MQIEIRPAGVSDCGAITDLSMRSKRSNGYDDAFMAACLDELTVTQTDIEIGQYWVAEADRIVGCVGLKPGPDALTGEITAFFIDPAMKRQGIGKALWDVVLRAANAHGITTLGLDSDPNAVPFYEALGFKTVGNSPSGSIRGRMIPRMERQIS